MINDRVVDEKEYNYTVDNDINVKVWAIMNWYII